MRWRTHVAQREPPYARDTVRCGLLTFLYSFEDRCLICSG